MKTVQIQELKRDLSALIERAAAGEAIEVTRHRRPVVWLVPAGHEGLHVGERCGRGRLEPLRDLRLSRPIAGTLADDRAKDR